MRELLFKAKCVTTGEWVEGGYAYTFNEDKTCHIVGIMKENHWIVEKNGNLALIDENTLCQYTGLTDKNGNKIWENDVLWVTDGDGNTGQSDTGLGEVSFILGLWYINGNVQNGLYDIIQIIGNEVEVIGNIFDNPELLEGGEVNG